MDSHGEDQAGLVIARPDHFARRGLVCSCEDAEFHEAANESAARSSAVSCIDNQTHTDTVMLTGPNGGVPAMTALERVDPEGPPFVVASLERLAGEAGMFLAVPDKVVAGFACGARVDAADTGDDLTGVTEVDERGKVLRVVAAVVCVETDSLSPACPLLLGRPRGLLISDSLRSDGGPPGRAEESWRDALTGIGGLAVVDDLTGVSGLTSDVALIGVDAGVRAEVADLAGAAAAFAAATNILSFSARAISFLSRSDSIAAHLALASLFCSSTTFFAFRMSEVDALIILIKEGRSDSWVPALQRAMAKRS